jgi:hypothetical protein
MNHAVEPRSVLTTIKRFLGDPAPAGRRNRSRAGLIVSILILPLLLGVMACFVLPVPIGNPEKSRIDPAMSGIWLAADESEGWLVALEPYDKRTWLVTWMMLEAATDEDEEDGDDGAEVDEPETAKEDDVVTSDPEVVVVDAETAESYLERLRDGAYVIDQVSFHKGWLTTIKGVRFMVWQPMVDVGSERGMNPEWWWVQRVESVNSEHMDTDFINPEFEDLGKVETRSQAEKLIRRHIKNPELFVEEGDMPDYERVPQEDYDLIAEMLDDFGIVSSVEDF